MQISTNSLADRPLPRIWPLKGPHRPKAFAEFQKAMGGGDVPLITKELARCMKFPAYWVMTYVFTKDEHDPIRPVKRLPRYRYIVRVIQELAREPRVLIPKSRQIRITWTCLSYILHSALFQGHRLNFVQSKKEEDAASLVGRQKHIYEHLPWWMKAASPLKHPLTKQPFNKLAFSNGSLIWGVPQGSDVLRQYTASIIFDDEMAFQERAEEAYKAAKPTVDGGGQFIGCSSVNGKNFFFRMCHDKLDAPEASL